MDVFPLFTAKAWIKNGVEATEHGREIWINLGIFEKNLIFEIYLTKLSNILKNLKKFKIVENINLVECSSKILQQQK